MLLTTAFKSEGPGEEPWLFMNLHIIMIEMSTILPQALRGGGNLMPKSFSGNRVEDQLERTQYT